MEVGGQIGQIRAEPAVCRHLCTSSAPNLVTGGSPACKFGGRHVRGLCCATGTRGPARTGGRHAQVDACEGASVQYRVDDDDDDSSDGAVAFVEVEMEPKPIRLDGAALWRITASGSGGGASLKRALRCRVSGHGGGGGLARKRRCSAWLPNWQQERCSRQSLHPRIGARIGAGTNRRSSSQTQVHPLQPAQGRHGRGVSEGKTCSVLDPLTHLDAVYWVPVSLPRHVAGLERQRGHVHCRAMRRSHYAARCCRSWFHGGGGGRRRDVLPDEGSGSGGYSAASFASEQRQRAEGNPQTSRRDAPARMRTQSRLATRPRNPTKR